MHHLDSAVSIPLLTLSYIFPSLSPLSTCQSVFLFKMFQSTLQRDPGAFGLNNVLQWHRKGDILLCFLPHLSHFLQKLSYQSWGPPSFTSGLSTYKVSRSPGGNARDWSNSRVRLWGEARAEGAQRATGPWRGVSTVNPSPLLPGETCEDFFVRSTF